MFEAADHQVLNARIMDIHIRPRIDLTSPHFLTLFAFSKSPLPFPIRSPGLENPVG